MIVSVHENDKSREKEQGGNEIRVKANGRRINMESAKLLQQLGQQRADTRILEKPFFFFKLILLLPLKKEKKTVFQFPFGHVITRCMYTTSSIGGGIREKGGAQGEVEEEESFLLHWETEPEIDQGASKLRFVNVSRSVCV